MRRLAPHPRASAALFALWLALAQSLSPGQIVLALVAALAGGLALERLDFPRARIRKPGAALRLAALVAVDVAVANFRVAAMILGARPCRRPGLVAFPVDLRDPYAVAALATIVSATPDTVWIEFDRDTTVLTLHVLDLADAAQVEDDTRRRYAAPLKEIFE